MSKAKHKHYRRVLKIKRTTIGMGEHSFPARIVYVLHQTEYKGANKAVTKRLDKPEKVYAWCLNIRVYAAGAEGYNHNRLFTKSDRQGLVVNLKRVSVEKLLEDKRGDCGRTPLQSAIDDWGKRYFATLKNVKATVRYLSGSMGYIDSEYGSTYFHTCNVNGANSLYPELVTNVSLDKGDAVIFDGHECLGAVNVRPLRESAVDTAPCKVCNKPIEPKDLVNKFVPFTSYAVHRACADECPGTDLSAESKLVQGGA